MSKTALIVDDSPLARHVLGKLLANYGLTVDTAESAEAALEYLKNRRPDVVFMDHLMPGMDGFEALEAIKANPATATIPVMMYTSQQGELYVGQARALGAIGVLPKELKPTEVAQVLRALRIIPAQVSEAAIRPAAVKDKQTAEDANVAALLEALFDQQRAALREEIRDGYERVLADSQRVPVLAEPRKAKPAATAWRVAAAILLLASVTFGLLYWDTEQVLSRSAARIERLEQSLAESLERSAETTNDSPRTAELDPGYLDTLVRAINLFGHYDFLEIPLDDRRAAAIGGLIEVLQRAGFVGTVIVEVNVGQFCMNYGLDGIWHLAPNDQLAQDCGQIGWSATEQASLGRRQSLAFANTVMGGLDIDVGIAVQTRSLGSDMPAVPYPLMTDYLTAGEWNAAAMENQRVEIRLFDASIAGPGTVSVR
jgi:CheY-like chemotaxis protein